MQRILLALAAFLILAPSAAAAASQPPTQEAAETIFVRDAKVARWLQHYSTVGWVPTSSYSAAKHRWSVYIFTENAGLVAAGSVDDSGRVTSAYTGPATNYTLARGHSHRNMVAGRWLSSWPVWLGFCAVFLVGLADLRRPLALRNLDLLALLSFTVSLAYLDAGRIFTSMPLIYPPLLYLLGRCAWIGLRGRPPREARPVWPVWLLAAATLALIGVRTVFVVANSQVTDVGYASVLGAQRIATGDVPYGNFPVDTGKQCGSPDSEGFVRARLQASGRCEIPLPDGGTYGPVAYESYIPAYWALGLSAADWTWLPTRTTDWSNLPAAHLTALVLDLACLGLLALIGWKLAGRRLAVTMAFAWAAFPFTQYVASASTNDALIPAFLLAGLAAVTIPWARGTSVALSGWTKFASLLLVPLWASYPDGRSKPREKVLYAVGFLVATYFAFMVLLLDPHPIHAAGVFWRHTISFQFHRHSPFSIWDWGDYHAGLLDLHWLQRPLEALVAIGAVALYFFPRRKSFLQLAALTAALLIALEVVLSYWFYLYIVWFFPFVVLALLSNADPIKPAADGA